RAFKFELALTTPDKSYLKTRYWDNRRSGLLSADHLLHDIKRMEVAYLDQNRRGYELTKHVSLALLDPEALQQLKATRSCTFTVFENGFDFDYPRHLCLPQIPSVTFATSCHTPEIQRSARFSPRA
ncbi:MAG TPA: hypothetical protein VEX68_20230, partial [Bryobacteraceae bacterium]|nr:hypothetical protein [Bryobacteraceae bacterium]